MSRGGRAFVTGLGALCAGAGNVRELRDLLRRPRLVLQRPTVFPSKGEKGTEALVAQVAGFDGEATSPWPRTHGLALHAAREAAGEVRPDVVIVGTTTGGILTTEAGLEAGHGDADAYRFHGLDTVALVLAETLGVTGPVLTVSTACSSAAVAIAMAHALLRAGLARRVLAGGVDSLSRLTFHGFRQLQLVAPEGCKPLDLHRTGMTVGEGAGFLLLEAQPEPGRRILAELAGTGLSCDAYHASSPHPEGDGAVLAMLRALDDAGLGPEAIRYVNLHGTGTPDNDAAEARALRRLFGAEPPPVSSIKGLTGHTLAAAGGIEAVASVIALEEGLLPANTGVQTVDPKLDIIPVLEPTRAAVETVLSNSFGFGGNNACLILTRPTGQAACAPAAPPRPALRIASVACLSGRGDLNDTLAALRAGQPVVGLVPDPAFAKAVPAPFIRRLKRLPRLVLALATGAHAAALPEPPDFIAVGTAWGPLAETYEFLRKLFESNDRFSSPTDFIGSVTNAPAGQVASLLAAQSPNLTFSSGDRSFDQAVLSASLGIAAGARHALVLAAEAHEPRLSPLLDPVAAAIPSDGGAAFCLLADDVRPGARLRWLGEAATCDALAETVATSAAGRFDAIALGVPSAAAEPVAATLAEYFPGCPIVKYRAQLGLHASAGATATAIAAQAVLDGSLPLAGQRLPLPSRRVLLVQAACRFSAMEVFA